MTLLMRKYQEFYQVMTEIALRAAKNVRQQKYEYTRSGPLTMCERYLIPYKMMLDWKARGQPPMEAQK